MMAFVPLTIWANPDHWIEHPPRADCFRPEEYEVYHHAATLAARDAEIARLREAQTDVRHLNWSGIENAPYDVPLTVLAGGMTFAAILRKDASLDDDENPCDQWQSLVEGEHPPCWTDGACWEGNDNGDASLAPEAFLPPRAALEPKP